MIAFVENWKSIAINPEYEVSDLGRVRHGRRILRPIYANGHAYASMGRRHWAMLAHLVLEAFVGPKPSKSHVAQHIDGDLQNNKAINLRWIPRSELLSGERSGSAKLTSEQVADARKRYAAGGTTITDLARECNVTQACMSLALHGKTWKNAGGPIA